MKSRGARHNFVHHGTALLLTFPDDIKDRRRNRKGKFTDKDKRHDKNEDTSAFVKADMKDINSVLVVKYPHKTDHGGVFSHMGWSLSAAA